MQIEKAIGITNIQNSISSQDDRSQGSAQNRVRLSDLNLDNKELIQKKQQEAKDKHMALMQAAELKNPVQQQNLSRQLKSLEPDLAGESRLATKSGRLSA